jgi:hypothetical protein
LRRLALLAAAVLALALLGVAQLVLPGIAAQRLRDRLAQSGTVLGVEVHAFPAIELLWHQADRVVVRLGQYRSSSSRLGSRLDEAGNVGTLDASAAVLTAGLLTVRDASLHKSGSELSAAARVTESDLRHAVAFLDGVTPVASGGGQLTLRGTATLLGVTVSADATVGAQNGRLLVQPNVPFGPLATVTLFSDPHVQVLGVSAGGIGPDGFSVSARGRLH